jgi:Calcineurin-like phosphoesterase
MSGKPKQWIPEHLRLAQETLMRYPRDRFQEAVAELRRALWPELSEAALRSAFVNRGLGSPMDYCQAPPKGPARLIQVPAPESTPEPLDADDFEIPVTVAEPEAGRVARLMAAVKKSRSFAWLCDHLDISPKRLRETIEEARAAGYGVDLAGDTVAVRPAQPSDDVVDVPLVSQPGEWRTFAVMSDLHFGSKYHLRAQLVDFVGKAQHAGAKVILLGGDLLDGCYRHGRWELTHHGFQDQVGDFVEGLPKGPQYYGITGNHDQTFENDSGMVVHEAINSAFRAAGREDMHLLGARGAYMRFRGPGERRGVFVEAWHPLKGPAYALTYKLQKHVEGYSVGAKPDFLFTGHWHQQAGCLIRGVHAYSCGTFQGGGSSFAKSLGGAPTIGGWIIQYALTPEGSVRRVRQEWVSYYERETAREVEL